MANGITVIVTGDVKRLTSHLSAVQRKVIPAVTYGALNDVAQSAKRQSLATVAKNVRLAVTHVRWRKYNKGGVKKERVIYKKASRNQKAALLRVYHTGIAFYKIAGKQTKVGVKGKGGRLIAGAFKQGALVHKRTSDKRYPIRIPHIPISRQLNTAVALRMGGRTGRALFERKFNERLRRKLESVVNG